MASYTTVLALALTQAPEKCLSLRSLYLFIEEHSHLLPFTARPQWRRSVRHALSRQHCFSRVDASGKAVDGGARRCLWTVDLSRLPQPTRAALNLHGDGMSLVDVLRRPNVIKAVADRTATAKNDMNSGLVTSHEHNIPAAAPATTAVATGKPCHAAPSQQLPSASGGVTVHAPSAALFGGQLVDSTTPQNGAAYPFLQAMLQRQQQITEQWEQPIQQYAVLQQHEQGQHQEQQCGQRQTNNHGTIALLSSWASLAGLSSEEISSALATAATAADTEGKRHHELKHPEEQAQGCLQGEQQRQRHEEERQQLRRHLGQCLEKYDVQQQQQQPQQLQQQLQQETSHQVLQEGQEQSLALLYQSQMLSALHSFDRPGRATLESYPRVSNNDSWRNMAAAAADLAAGCRFALGASASDNSGSLVGTSQLGTRDSGLADEIDDDLILEALDPDAYRLAPGTRYAMLLELVKSLNHTKAPSMQQQGLTGNAL